MAETTGRRVAWRFGNIVRSSWKPALVALIGGFAVELVLDLPDRWIAAAVSVASALGCALLLAVGERRDPRLHSLAELRTVERAVVHEWSNAAQQVAFALGMAALILAGFAAGSGVAALVGR